MDVFQAIKTRRSVRKYKSDPIPEDKLNKILEAARLAPSARNSQSWKFIVVRDLAKRKELVKAANNQEFLAQAPVVIAAVSSDPDNIMFCEVPTYAVDLAIAVDHMILTATEEGLGACWIGAFSQNEVKRILNIPPDHKVVILLPLGFADEEPRQKVRKELKDIVCWESFK